MNLRLFAPPQLRPSEEEAKRGATWLELFYDLVFVVAVNAIGNRLFTHVSLIGIFQAFILFLPIWWAGVGHTIYDTRFDTDDLFQRLCTFGIMLAAAAMAITIPSAFEGQASLFALSYILARIFLIGMHIRAYRHIAEARPIIRLYLIGFSIGDSMWLISLLLPVPWCYVLWIIGMAINLATPWLGIRTLQHAPINTSHVPERFASFAIIILGEIISVIIASMTRSRLQISSLLAFIPAFCICACIWWIYFTFLDIGPVKQKLGPGQPYIYVHLPLLFGLLIVSVGLEYAVAQASLLTLPIATLWLLGVGLELWFFAGFALKLVMFQRLSAARLSIRLITGVGTVLIFLIGTHLSPLLVLTLLLGILLFFIAFEAFFLSTNEQERSQQ